MRYPEKTVCLCSIWNQWRTAFLLHPAIGKGQRIIIGSWQSSLSTRNLAICILFSLESTAALPSCIFTTKDSKHILWTMEISTKSQFDSTGKFKNHVMEESVHIVYFSCTIIYMIFQWHIISHLLQYFIPLSVIRHTQVQGIKISAGLVLNRIPNLGLT